jgi:hypothetical protein
MKSSRLLMTAVCAVTFAAPAFAAAPAPPSGFVVRLGRDTTSAERYTREAGRTVVDQVGRSPRVMQRHFEYEYAPDGALRHFSMVVRPAGAPAGAPPTQTIDATLASDSLTVVIRRDTTSQTSKIKAPTQTLVVALSSPWVVYENLTMRLAKSKPDSVKVPMVLLGGNEVYEMVVRRMGRDSVELENPEGVYHLSVAKDGRILAVVPIKGTAQFTAMRVEGLDPASYAAAFLAREQQAGAMGTLSPRDTVNVANAGGAALWIDYGRPSKRGRVIFGGVVPFGDMWRTGANAATQFRTDKPLELGGTALPAGTYTLWTVPSPTSWKLTINSQTGQWGTDHDASKDLFTVDMAVSTLAAPVERFTISVTSAADGGTLNMDWDTTRASVAFKVKS